MNKKNEIDKVEKQFDNMDEVIKSMTLDKMNEAPKQETEPQTKLSQKDLEKSEDIYLKPHRRLASVEKFNEKYRKDYEFDKEYVNFIAENLEIKGETIDMWTKPYPGLPAEWWQIPVNKPIWAPRYVAEQVKRKSYHTLVMDQQTHSTDGYAQYYGNMAVEKQVQRLDAHPVSSRKSVFMGAETF